MMHPAPDQTQPRRVSLTPADVQALGYVPRYTYLQNDRALVPYYTPGTAIDTPAGRQGDSTYLYDLDLDQHQAGQDAAAQLQRIIKRVGPELAAKLVIKRSRGGQGYHLPFRTHRVVSELPSVKVYDPLKPAQHIGELIGLGGRVTLTGDYLQGGPESIPLLSAIELDKLSAAIHTPTLYRAQPTSGAASGAQIINGLTPRKQRMLEGLSLIGGWERITDAYTQLDAYCAKHAQLAKRRAALRTDTDRSTAYARFVQSLMLHAWRFGATTPARCQVVAALAIAQGANGKEQERDYKIERDTAVLIARILNGDGHFAVPGWANRYGTTPAVASNAPTHRQRTNPPAKGRPAGSRADAVERLYRVLDALAPDGFGRRVYTLELLADELRRRFKLSVSTRTISGYLSTLRGDKDPQNARITTSQIAGNGMAFCLLLSHFGDADKAQNRVNTPAESAAVGHADASRIEPIPTPQTTADSSQCIKEEGTPKAISVPTTDPLPAAGLASAPLAPLAAPVGGRGAAPFGAPSGDSRTVPLRDEVAMWTDAIAGAEAFLKDKRKELDEKPAQDRNIRLRVIDSLLASIDVPVVPAPAVPDDDSYPTPDDQHPMTDDHVSARAFPPALLEPSATVEIPRAADLIARLKARLVVTA